MERVAPTFTVERKNRLAEEEYVLLKEMRIKTEKRNQLKDITSDIISIVAESGVDEGECHIFVPHTTAAVTINEKADPAVADDISRTLERIVPEGWDYGHSEGNSDSHIKSSLVGASEFVLIEGGRPVLGTWQAVFFCEFDGPRNRRYIVRVKKN